MNPSNDDHLEETTQLTKLPQLHLHDAASIETFPEVGVFVRDWNRVCKLLESAHENLPWLHFPEQVILTRGGSTSSNEIPVDTLSTSTTEPVHYLTHLAWKVLRMASDIAVTRQRAFGGTIALEETSNGTRRVMGPAEAIRRSALLLVPFVVEQAQRLSLATKDEAVTQTAIQDWMGSEFDGESIARGVVRWHKAQNSTPWQLGRWMRQISDPTFSEIISNEF